MNVIGTIISHVKRKGGKGIAEQKRAEDALRESEERFRVISASALDAVILINDDGNGVYWNPAAERIFEYASEEIMGQNVHDALMPERYRAQFKKGFKEFKETGEGNAVGKVVELTAKRKGGDEFPMEIAVSPIRIKEKYWASAIIRDITERKQHEEQLKKFQFMVESAHDAIFFKDLQSRYVMANNKTIEAFGLSRDEVIGKNDLEIMSEGEEAKINIEADKFVFKTGETKKITKHMTGADGKEYWFQAIKTPHFDNNGNIVGLVGIARDITELKQSEKLKERLIQSDRLAAIGQLAAGVAHELNNPLGYVYSNLNSLREYIKDLKKYYQAVHEFIEETDQSSAKPIRRKAKRIVELGENLGIVEIMEDIESLSIESINGAKRAKDIVINLKNFSRPGETKPSMADINEGIESTIAIVWNEIRYHIKINKELGDLPLISCRSQELNQVVLNLLLNAAQAMKEPGNIWIRSRSKNGFVEIEVEDEGEGIPPENISKIFDPFFTTKPVGKGTGLGLSISYGIVQRHNGEMLVDSTPGKGSKFTVRIPNEGIIEENERRENAE